MNVQFDPKTNSITDGTYTMKISMFPMRGMVSVDVFGEGRIAPKLSPETVGKTIARLTSEIFPKFVAYRQAKEAGDFSAMNKLFNEIEYICWDM